MSAVHMEGIFKRFGQLQALEGVDFDVAEGEIHAIVGENGAGKTTLMKVLYGMHRPDAGRIRLFGKEANIQSPAAAISLGIGMVHQHFMLVPPLSVMENLILGDEPVGKFWIIDRKKARRRIEELITRFRLGIDPDQKISGLSVGLQQKVEILKLLYREARVLVLDEPTAVLTPQETEELFEALRKLRGEGKTVILITHKLNEVLAISDTTTVMRRGKRVGSLPTAEATGPQLARMMVGREISAGALKKESAPSGIVLEVRNLTLTHHLRDVSFNIRGGEILGIAAVEGNGQSELVQVIAGQRKPTSGSIEIAGQGVYSSRRVPVAHIPEDRLREGIISEFSVAENFTLGRQKEKEFGSRFFLSRSSVAKFARELMGAYDIRPSDILLPIAALSGGNQQKVVVARELSKNSPLVVASQPTRGLDVGAIEFVHSRLLESRDSGRAVLLVSSDLSELLALSDRIGVLFKGELVALVRASGTDSRELGAAMTGVSRQAV